MDDERRRAGAHVFVHPATLDLPAPAVEEPDRHHLERVLRLRPGEFVSASDGRGRWRACRWMPGGHLEAAGPVLGEPPPAPAVTVAFALLKGDRDDWVVQKLTEIGVDRLVPFVAERSVVRLDPGSERALRQVRRWRQVCREAAMQSRRVWLPVVDEVGLFRQAVAELGPGEATLAEPGGTRLSLRNRALMIGPEGGWSPAELAEGLPTVDLGPTVLRGETAALVAGVLLCALRYGTIHHEPGSPG